MLPCYDSWAPFIGDAGSETVFNIESKTAQERKHGSINDVYDGELDLSEDLLLKLKNT